MATPTTSIRDFCTLLAKSRLLAPDEVEAIHKRWRDEGHTDEEQTEAFGKFLVSRRVLTPYQAAMVQRGRADGFFLNGYKILDRIGKGQMGGVYKAVHTLGQVVALKILPASKAKDPHFLGRFQREARLLTQLEHPNVVRAFQVGDANGVHYIAMEYLEGETLDEVLYRRRRLPIPEAIRIARHVLDGLQHLHDRRMVHRDLKPSNLMLTPSPPPTGKPDTTWDATVRVLDIGLGRELFDENTPEGQVETQLTVEGAVLGTPDYLAPEQARDARSADGRADIYSLGCVLYQTLTGRTPFPDQNIMAQMLRHATERPAPLRDSVPNVPAGLQEVFDRLTAKNPEDRYQTAAEASEALRPFLSPNAGVVATPVSLVPAYRQWLETESQMELPRGTLPAVPESQKAAAKAATASIKPGTGAATPLQTSSKPVPPTRPAPAPVQQSPVQQSVPPRSPRPRPPVDEVEVELVTNLQPIAPPPMMLPVPEPIPIPSDRPLWEMDRRDLMMLVGGGAGVLFAVGFGYLLAQVFRRKPTDPIEEEKKE